MSIKRPRFQARVRFQPAIDCPRRTLGTSLDILEPPYSAYRPASILAGTGSFATSLVLAIRLGEGAHAGSVVRHALARLAVLVPTVPRIVRLAAETDARALSHAFHLGRLHAHAIVVDGQDPGDALRPVLTDPSMVASIATEWLKSRLPMVPHEIRAELAARIADERPAAISASWRARLRRCRVPPPVQWSCLARAVQAAISIQADPRRRIADVAFSLHFEEQSSLTALIGRCFGLRPTELRGTLGVAWLMDRWATRNGIATEDLLQIELLRAMRSYGIR